MNILLIGNNAVSLRGSVEMELERILAQRVEVKPISDILGALGMMYDGVDLILLRISAANSDEVKRIGRLKDEYTAKVVCMITDPELGFVNMHSSSMFREIAEFLKMRQGT